MHKIIGHQIDDGPREHFIDCPKCGERLDMRDLGEVLGHQCGSFLEEAPLVPALKTAVMKSLL
jgi:hypothetical protein